MAPVGAVVFSHYWKEHYTVVSHNRLKLSSGYSVTVQWHGDGKWANPRAPRQTTHMTPLESRDRIQRYIRDEDMEAHLTQIREGSERRTSCS